MADDTFAAAHDSYWTHAGTVTALGRILREQFVALHSRPLIVELHEQFRRRYPGTDIPRYPTLTGGLDLRHVSESENFFN